LRSSALVSRVAVMMQGGSALFVFFAIVFLGESASTREWAGLGGIFVAMILLSLSLQGGAAEGATDAFARNQVTKRQSGAQRPSA
jgi:drug/metabolite transporter (DMT)-like permease